MKADLLYTGCGIVDPMPPGRLILQLAGGTPSA